MAEEDNKNAQTGTADQNAENKPAKKQGSNLNSEDKASKPVHKKRRRPRRRKKKPLNTEVTGVSEILPANLEKEVIAEPEKLKKKPRKRNKKPKNENIPKEDQTFVENSPVDDFKLEVEPEVEPEIEPEVEPEAEPEVEPEVEPETEENLEDTILDEGEEPIEEPIEENEDFEEKYLASQDENKDEEAVDEPEPILPVEAAPPPDLPEEINTPTTSIPQTEEEGPVGWDELKNAIKQNYDGTDEMPSVIPVAPEGLDEENPKESVSSNEVIEEVKPEPVEEPFAPPSPKSELAADDAAEKKEIVQIIIKYAVGGCVVMALIIGIFLFNLPGRIYDIATGIFSSEPKVVTETPVDNGLREPTVKQPTDTDKFDEGVGTAIITGEQIPKIRKVSNSIQTLYKIGITELVLTAKIDVIASHMKVLLQLQNAFETDINKLLDSTADRSQALEVHLKELQDSLVLANETYAQVNEVRDQIKIDFNEVTTRKTQLEEDFFVSMQKLESAKANVLLTDFIDASKKQVELKAEYNALNKTAEMFAVAIKNMDARIKDVILNKSALVKGVKVIDIKGSDLDLIIQETDL